ncbi:MAG: hypothetical protein K8R40_10235 [Anaerolineaceae bacterium]|nr:hypothetical protein [Anaerolineaceae bacterium]
MGNQQIKKTKRTYQRIFSFFTAFFIILLAAMVIYFLLIFAEPQSILNLFPPATSKNSISQNEIALALTQTIAIENQFTPIPSITPTASCTATKNTPTNIFVHSPDTSASITPTMDKAVAEIQFVSTDIHPDQIFYTPTPTPKTGYLYSFILVKEPRFYESPYNEFAENPILNCNWLGVGGQVFDILGQPLSGLNIRLGGFSDEEEFEYRYTKSGDSIIFGDSGYEFELGDKPVYSPPSKWIQLIDEEGLPLSAKVHFSTTGHCTQNWIMIDFIQVK